MCTKFIVYTWNTNGFWTKLLFSKVLRDFLKNDWWNGRMMAVQK